MEGQEGKREENDILEFTVSTAGSEKKMKVPRGTLVIDMIRALGLFPDAVLVFIGEEPVPLDEEIEPGVFFRVSDVTSGG